MNIIVVAMALFVLKPMRRSNDAPKAEKDRILDDSKGRTSVRLFFVR